jgi:hypothetical protein
MEASRSRARIVLALGAGVVLGWLASGLRARPMRAASSDRAGECVVVTGPVLQQFDDTTKAPMPLDALYFLDYKGGRLIASVPSYRSDGTKTQILDGFAERDLVADFKLDLEGGPHPRFLMTTGSMGRYSAGWSPLYVFETTTGQVAVYRLQVGSSYGSNASSQFDLVELRRYTKPAGAQPKS